MRRVVERMRSSCGPACRARWHLAWGYCRGCASSLDEAWISFQAARLEADDVEDPGLARVLRLRALVELAIVALATGTASRSTPPSRTPTRRSAGRAGSRTRTRWPGGRAAW